MRRFRSPVKNLGYFMYRWSSPFIDIRQLGNSLLNFPRYFKDLTTYSFKVGAEPIGVMNTYPVLGDKISWTPFDSHYFYQDIWAANKIFKSRVKRHVDIGSNIEFVAFLTAFTKVEFVDIRPLRVNLKNFKSFKASIIRLPFRSNTVASLSCLHVAEHVGLGRYGDRLDPYGTKKACRELSRVLAKGGNLYFSVPVGKPKLCFNAHRVHSPKTILEYFKGLRLVEFSGIDDRGRFLEKISIDRLENSDYACGLFWFTKR